MALVHAHAHAYTRAHTCGVGSVQSHIFLFLSLSCGLWPGWGRRSTQFIGVCSHFCPWHLLGVPCLAHVSFCSCHRLQTRSSLLCSKGITAYDFVEKGKAGPRELRLPVPLHLRIHPSCGLLSHPLHACPPTHTCTPFRGRPTLGQRPRPARSTRTPVQPLPAPPRAPCLQAPVFLCFLLLLFHGFFPP